MSEKIKKKTAELADAQLAGVTGGSGSYSCGKGVGDFHYRYMMCLGCSEFERKDGAENNINCQHCKYLIP